MKLSILLLNYRTKGLLRQCLRGIAAHPPSAPYEVLVVDNGSGDGSVEMVREQFPSVRLVALPTNIGYAAGTNVGLAQAQGEFILLLNTDIVIMEGALDELLRGAEEQPRAAIIGPLLLHPDRSVQESAFAFHRWWTPVCQRTPLGRFTFGKQELRRFLLKRGDEGAVRMAPWLMSSCVLIRREALASIGTFDERFFVYLSDTDICRRAWEAGWHVVQDRRVAFFHYHRRQSAEDLRVALIHIFDFLKYLWKWRGKTTSTA